jgi:hypothetical protein
VNRRWVGMGSGGWKREPTLAELLVRREELGDGNGVHIFE